MNKKKLYISSNNDQRNHGKGFNNITESKIQYIKPFNGLLQSWTDGYKASTAVVKAY